MRTVGWRASTRHFSCARLCGKPISQLGGAASIKASDQDADTTRSTRDARRRTVHDARARTGIPAPPAVPDWFLKNNVILKAVIAAPVRKIYAKVHRIIDKRSKESYFDLPFFAQRKHGQDPEKPIAAPGPLHTLDWPALHAQLLIFSLFSLAKHTSERDPSEPLRSLMLRGSDLPQSSRTCDELIERVADLTKADIIHLDANDIAELAGAYIDGPNTSSGAVSALAYDVYEGGHAPDRKQTEQDNIQRDHDDQALQPGLPNPADLRAFLNQHQISIDHALGAVKVVGLSVGIPQKSMQPNMISSDLTADNARGQAKDGADIDEPSLSRWQALKLEALFDGLLDAPKLARSAELGRYPGDIFRSKKCFDIDEQNSTANLSGDPTEIWTRLPDDTEIIDEVEHRDLRWKLSGYLSTSGPLQYVDNDKLELSTENYTGSMPAISSLESPAAGTIVHVPDLDAIRDTPQGDVIVKRLLRSIRKRQRNGEPIVLVGTSSDSINVPVSKYNEDAPEDDDFLHLDFSSIEPVVAASQKKAWTTMHVKSATTKTAKDSTPWDRIRKINLRNVQQTIRHLGFDCSKAFSDDSAGHLCASRGGQLLAEAIIPIKRVKELVLFAHGLRALYTSNPDLNLVHIILSYALLQLPSVAEAQGRSMSPTPSGATEAVGRSGSSGGEDKTGGQRLDLESIVKGANKHEQRLVSGIADPSKIKTTFNDVHAPASTIEALKSVTTLSLIRPDAFTYGVLENDRLPGLLLYGPPGTGKTMLAKAVAKDSRAIVLEISGAQIYEKYVGEGEKMVRAVFSLAKKLSPCIVFLDEADALFGMRGASTNRTTHRELINQFLREWDGMSDHKVFIMVATNRPFDLDDAVLRRLPRRILVDLPTADDRANILGIHLKGEQLADEVVLQELAQQTPFYSGSDLKNLCVAAALAAVKEENELLARQDKDSGFKLPEKRTLGKRHFDKAVQEISASISEDMSSLKNIKKFDEQYGDRRGKQVKSGYGFGEVDSSNDDAARVRSEQDRRP